MVGHFERDAAVLHEQPKFHGKAGSCVCQLHWDVFKVIKRKVILCVELQV